MSPAPQKPVRRKWLRRGFLILGAAVLLAVAYLSSDSFERRLQAAFVDTLEQTTGGKVEVGSFSWSLSRLEVVIQNLTLRGREPSEEAPFLHVARLQIRLKVVSFLGAKVGLRELVVEKPVLRLITFPDGATNLPLPRTVAADGRSPVAPLFDLALDRLRLTDGELRWNHRRFPFSAQAAGVNILLSYSSRLKSYVGEVTTPHLALDYAGSAAPAAAVDVAFRLAPDAAEVSQLRASAGKSRLQARGRVESFLRPTVNFAWDGELELGELRGLLRLPALRSGRLFLQGEGRHENDTVAAAGKLRWQGVEWRDGGLRLANLTGGADFSADRQNLKLSHVFAHLLGGTATGEVEVRNLGDKTPAAASGQEQGSRARLQLEGLKLAALAAALSTPARPLATWNLAGTLRGNVQLEWADSPSRATAAFLVDVAPPPQLVAGQVPVEVHLKGVYSAGAERLEVSEFRASASAVRVQAAGALGAPSSRLNVDLSVADLAELQRAVTALGFPWPHELAPRGQVSFAGFLSGRLRSPSLQGRVEAASLTTELDLQTAAESFTGPRPDTKAQSATLDWDSFSADVEYGSERLAARNAVLQRGDARLNFDFSAALSHGRLLESSPLELRASVRAADLAELQKLAGSSLPITGRIDLALEAKGPARALAGHGSLSVQEGTLFGEPFRSLASDIRLAGGAAELANLRLAQNGAQVRGIASYHFAREALHFELTGSEFHLAGLEQLQHPKFSVAGAAEFSARGDLSPARKDFQASLRLRSLVLNGEESGDFQIDARTQDGVVHLTGRSQFPQAELALDGTIQLVEGYPARLAARFAHWNVDPILRTFFRGRITSHSSANGVVEMQGPLHRPRQWTMAGRIEQLGVEIEGVRLENDGPIEAALADEKLHVRQFHIVGESTDLTGQGTVGLAGKRDLDLTANGRVDLRLLQTIDPDLQAYGDMALSVAVRGSVAAPALRGEVRITRAGVSLIDAPAALSDINGVLVFNENRLQVQSLSARTGGGRLDLGGYIAYSRGLYFNLTATGREIRLRYPPGISSVADADLRFVGSAAGSMLSGEVTVTRFAVGAGFDLATYLVRSKQASAMPPAAGKVLENMRLNVHISSTPELQVKTTLARLTGDLDLRLRGTAARPALLGRVNIAEGRILFNGTEYQLNQGDVTFSNPVRIEPVLNLDASARVRQYDISIGFHGTADRMSTTYRSDPPLPTSDIIALLAMGRTREEAVLTRQPTETFTETASNAILSQALNATVSSRVQKLFGVSRIKIDPQVGGPENNPNARLTIEQQVSDQVTLTYITNLSQSAQQVIQAEFNLSRTVSVVAVRDENGVVGFEVKIRHRRP